MKFDCTPSCRPEALQGFFLDLLVRIEARCGFELTITSAFRTVDYEKSKGRPGTSSHCLGLAADISARDSRSRYKIIDAALIEGVRRIGIYKTFIHLDVDGNKFPDCIWLG